MDNVVQSAVDLPSHPMVQAVAKATINYDRTKIHTIDMVNMEQFDKDLAAGIITNNQDMRRRINGKLEANWNENFNNMCKVGEDANYDPDYFNNFCANFYWCLRLFTTNTCSPYMAVGLTSQ